MTARAPGAADTKLKELLWDIISRIGAMDAERNRNADEGGEVRGFGQGQLGLLG